MAERAEGLSGGLLIKGTAEPCSQDFLFGPLVRLWLYSQSPFNLAPDDLIMVHSCRFVMHLLEFTRFRGRTRPILCREGDFADTAPTFLLWHPNLDLQSAC